MLRRVVLWSGLALVLVGTFVIAGLSVGPAWSVPAGIAWTLGGVWQAFRLRATYGYYQGLRLHADGHIELRRPDGSREAAQLLSGSFVLPGFAWFRIRLADGRTSGQLLRGNMQENEAWRRLQVVWRHLGAGS